MNLNRYFKTCKRIAYGTFKFLSSIFYPPRCIICNKLFCKQSFDDDIFICSKCKKQVKFTSSSSSLCKKCSRPIDDGNILCNGCQISQHYFDVGFSCVLYETQMRTSLLSYKFGNARYKYRVFSRILYDYLINIIPFPPVDVICSVPIGEKRKQKRGFDHVAPFARYISLKTKLPYDKKALLKIKESVPQSKLSFKERQLAVKGAFKVMNPEFVKDKSVLLIDDIYTTGATASEISKILKRAGAKYVAILTLCITPEINTGDDLKT